MRRRTGSVILLAVLLAACAQPQQPRTAANPDQDLGGQRSESHAKRVTAVIMGDPPGVVQAVAGFGSRGVDALEHMVGAGLTVIDNTGRLQSRLAEAVPSLENGLWVVLPGGEMETTWRIRQGALWQDGTPVTADDVLFSAKIEQDKDLPFYTNAVGWAAIDGFEAPDQQTIKVHWKQPQIEADGLFSDPVLPKHLLERQYLDDKANFMSLPYWADEYVGAGPYKVREFLRGTRVTLEANDSFVLGRPRVDVIEVRFIPDPSTIIANIMAGEIDVTLGKTLSAEQGIEAANQWKDGKLDFTASNIVSIYPQFIGSNPPIVRNVQFRRALIHAIDRQQMVDSLLPGLSSVAHSLMYPGQAQYKDIEEALPRYEYDPRLASQMIEGLGYTRSGEFFRDQAGQPLNVELRTYTVDINQKATLSVADFWQRAGVSVTPNVMSPQAAQNNEYVFTFPAFILQRYTSDLPGLKQLHSSRTPLPENNFRSGNVSRYMNPEFDAMLDTYFSTVPIQQRIQALGQILYHMADQLTQMGLFYDAEPTMLSNRLQNVTARWPSSTQAWNVQAWDVR
ncbi:MAG TPA: ABC transporter substrate-binding protein [Chloroflexota bacterium]|nr:ABC transporter substrate-binding protein [Chloroflexota bacterium]